MDWIPFNDLSRAISAQREALDSTMAEVLDSGWLVHGPQHSAFEKELATYLAAPHAAGVANGTDALELALRAIMPAGRTRVVTAANCGGYTSTAARRGGYDVAYADIDAQTHVLTPTTLAPVLDETVGAVVVTHLYGHAVDVAAIRAICEPWGVMVVEDCAQALGAGLPGARSGSFGDAAAFSFYPTKNLGALGDGGAVVSRTAETDATIRRLRQYGWDRKYSTADDGGRNSRLDELQAAVLRMRLARLDDLTTRRREILRRYAQAASHRATVLGGLDESHAAHLAVVVTDDIEALRKHLTDQKIQSDVHYPIPDHRQPAVADDYLDTSLPTTEALASRILSVPLFPELREDEIERVCDALATF
ncbi:DegT/DnrJ/EryC1/StrS family aminotransferase [Oerskovia paurometabola]|uniref:DegT/DnrJ/EryC1/StrS family aminotransferase n=1 Tax=Oerskovia paurometabola TaxID=162170 RepID=A0ABW1X6R2_9CELL|nr:DegT/DnrJ/EryC1/StrS family aminotransferase [Oerskovia paurometabola]MBM7496415.1 dTDP-4-amino-4,6-dideoxygalactose transaminase [Oerskovia paurometabola]